MDLRVIGIRSFPQQTADPRDDTVFVTNSIWTTRVTSFDLVVLMVADSGLRSALAACLTSMGENVMTVSRKLLPVELERLADQKAVLVADQAMAADSLASILANSGWRHVVILNGRASPDENGRPLRLRHEDAIVEVTAALESWRKATPPQ